MDLLGLLGSILESALVQSIAFQGDGHVVLDFSEHCVFMKVGYSISTVILSCAVEAGRALHHQQPCKLCFLLFAACIVMRAADPAAYLLDLWTDHSVAIDVEVLAAYTAFLERLESFQLWKACLDLQEANLYSDLHCQLAFL